MDAGKLKESKHLSILTDEDFELLGKIGEIQTLSKGQTLCSQGEDAKVFYIVTAGWVSITTFADGRKKYVSEAVNGDLIGWSSIIKPYTYTATATSREAAEVACFNGDDLIREMEANNGLGYRFMETIAKYLSMRLRGVVFEIPGKMNEIYRFQNNEV